MRRRFLLGGSVLLVAACSVSVPDRPAAVGSIPPSAAAVTPVQPSSPAAVQQRVFHSGRVARPILDPAAGQVRKVARYWSMAAAEPFEILDTVIKNETANPAAATTLDMTARVLLPSKKAVTKAFHTFRLAQAAADDDELDGADDGDEVDGAGAGLQDDGDDEDAFEIGELPEFDGEDDAELDAAEPDPDGAEPEIDEEVDDIPDSEEGYLVDADNDDLFEPGETEPYVDPLPEATKKQLLAAGHEVRLRFEDKPVMSDDPDRCTIEDLTSRSKLEVRFDQDRNRLTISNQAGSLRFELNPDDTMTIDGQRTTNARDAARLMAAHPVVRGTDTHVLALMFARRARSPLTETRGKHPCNTDDSRFSSDISDRSQDSGSQNAVHIKPSATPTPVIGPIPVPGGAIENPGETGPGAEEDRSGLVASMSSWLFGKFAILASPSPRPRINFQDPVGDLLRVLIQGRTGEDTIKGLAALSRPATKTSGAAASK